MTSVDVVRGDVVEEEEEDAGAMSPDSNHNHQLTSPSKDLEITMKLVKKEPESSEDETPKNEGEDVRIKEYLQRTDTAVIFPEDPKGVTENGEFSATRSIDFIST